MPTKPTKKTLKTDDAEKNKSWSKTDFNYASTAWIQLRDSVKREQPLCVMCLKVGKLTPTQVIDHKKPISQGGAAWDRDNLQGLCNTCHGIKTRRERQ